MGRVIVMGPSGLRWCDQCGRKWPDDVEHELRSMAWLDPLPRKISPLNIDKLLIHNRMGGPEFLGLEVKGPDSPPMSNGQREALMALASLSPRLAVWVLKGDLSSVLAAAVTREGFRDVRGTTASLVRLAIVDWLEGRSLRLPKEAA